jgi:hypothetical protein
MPKIGFDIDINMKVIGYYKRKRGWLMTWHLLFNTRASGGSAGMEGAW